jgi:hypothetical protein
MNVERRKINANRMMLFGKEAIDRARKRENKMKMKKRKANQFNFQ